MLPDSISLLVALGVLMMAGCESGLDRPEFGSGLVGADTQSGGGTMSMAGSLAGWPVNVNAPASATVKYDRMGDGSLVMDAIDIWTSYADYYYIGLELEDPSMLASGRTFGVGGQFDVEVIGHPVGQYYGVDDVAARSGHFTVSSFGNSSLVASYSITLYDGSTLSGEINLSSFSVDIPLIGRASN